MIDQTLYRCTNTLKGKSVLAIVDTTEINCQGHINRLQSKKGLGPLSDNKTLGYYLQPILCLDANSKSPLGIAGVHLWNRTGESLVNYKHRYITERESNKWYTPLLQGRDSILQHANDVTFVMDREADIYEVLDAIPKRSAHLVIRSNHDRMILHNGQKIHLKSFLAKQPVQGSIRIQLQSGKRCGNWIVGDLRFAEVIIPKSKNNLFLSQTSDYINMSVVEVEERSMGREKIYWRLWSSKKISTPDQAREIVDIYKSRWHIEELFRLMKTEAFDIESSELEKPQNLFKLGVLVMEASLLIAQLKAVRDTESEIQTNTIFTQPEIDCLEAINSDLMGTTEKQSNPFSQKSLSWASWIIARIGGWKGYYSQRPPGSITYKRGLERFYDFYEGFQLARLMYKR